jgi:hypothetical protein
MARCQRGDAEDNATRASERCQTKSDGIRQPLGTLK